MAMKKPILDIDINDGKFREFLALFSKFQKALGSMPKAWGATNAAIEDSAGSATKLTEEMIEQKRLSEELAEIEDRAAKRRRKLLDDEHERQKKRLNEIKNATQQVASGLLGAAGSFTKMLGVGGILSGLAGAGGLFGFDRMAHGVSDAYRTSTGYGMSLSKMQAFDVQFGGLSDTHSLMQATAQAQNDPSQNYAYGRLGINPRGMAKDELMIQVMKKTGELWEGVGKNKLRMQGYGLEGIGAGNFEDWQNWSERKGELNQRIAAYRATSGAGISNSAAQDYAELSRQLEETSFVLKSSFLRVLKAAAPAVKDFSKSFETLVKKLSDNGTLSTWVKQLSGGIEWLAKKIGDPSFQQSIADFAGKMIDIVDKLEKILVKIFGWVFPDEQDQGARKPESDRDRRAAQSWAKNNPGNVKDRQGNFRSFHTVDEGIWAAANQFDRYANDRAWNSLGADRNTIAKMIRTYTSGEAPEKQNAHILAVSKYLHTDPNQHLDFSHTARGLYNLARLAEAEMNQVEGYKKTSSGHVNQVILGHIKIEDRTGGGVAITAGQAAAGAH